MNTPTPKLVIDEGPRCGDRGGRCKDGSPCEAFRNLSETTGLCMHHDPARADEALALVKAGGAASGAPLLAKPPSFPPDTLEHVAKWHAWATASVAKGKLPSRLADSICRHLKELRPVLLGLGMEQRVRELEAQLKAAQKELGARKRRHA